MLKKLLIGLGLILGACIVSFLLIAWFMPRLDYKLSFTIHKPIDQVFVAFLDIDLMKDYMANLKSIEMLHGKPGEVGTKFRLTFEENGDHVFVEEEIIAVEPNKYLKFSMDNKVLEGFGEFKLAAKDSTTSVTYINNVRGKNIFWKSILALARSTIIERTQNDFDRFKAIIEKN